MNKGASESPAWTKRWLIAAGAYNLLWGALVIALPDALFEWAGMAPMLYPQIWQCIGMIVGVYGVGYLIAARDPRRHWPIVLVGFLGKVFGPIGFAFALAEGSFTPRFGVTILTNDLVWWVPFAMILWDAARSADAPPEDSAPSVEAALNAVEDQRGRTLRALTDEGPTLVELLRHSGCIFCRETLNELKRRQEELRDRGYRIAIVTMADREQNAVLASHYGLESASWFSDPDRLVYRALELQRGGFLDLFGPRVVLGGLRALLRGNLIGRKSGDGFQMPGSFVLDRGRVVRAFRPRAASDRPDYESLACRVSP